MSGSSPVTWSDADGGGAATRARAVALYLPQFHPIPENDEWWGPGFTEWTNVARARPRFPGHRQPRLPGALGFYDLRLPEVRRAQADLAEAAGIEGFAYWHYWFGNGRQLLERPFAEVLASGEPGLGFCLAWANQTWTGIWHGDPGRVLVRQEYPGPADEEAHFRTLLPAFTDPRYLRVGGRLLFLLQDPADLPDAVGFTDRWRALAEREGLGGFHFVGEAPAGDRRPSDYGFDQWLRPTGPCLPHRVALEGWPRARRALLRRLTGVAVAPYRAYADAYLRTPLRADEVPVALAGWDNTPRSGRRGVVLDGFDAAAWAGHLGAVVDAVADRSAEERLVVVKSWNEWAEGNVLEPDVPTGDALLAATRNVLRPGPA